MNSVFCIQTLRQRNHPRLQKVTFSLYSARSVVLIGLVLTVRVLIRSCRSKSNQYPNTSLIQIEGVNTKEEVTWYQGKRMAYIYKAKVKKDGSHYRCIWGKVIRPHGNSGVVRAKFKSNLPPKSMVFSCSFICVILKSWVYLKSYGLVFDL